jgi:hypothetical protein
VFELNDGFDWEDVELMLDLIHGRREAVLLEEVPRLFPIVDYFQCDQLKDACVEAIIQARLDEGDLVSYRSLAIKYEVAIKYEAAELKLALLLHSNKGTWSPGQMQDDINLASTLSGTDLKRLMDEYEFCGAVHAALMLQAWLACHRHRDPPLDILDVIQDEADAKAIVTMSPLNKHFHRRDFIRLMWDYRKQQPKLAFGKDYIINCKPYQHR